MPEEEKEVKKPLLGKTSTGVVAGGIGFIFFAALATLGSSIIIAAPVGVAMAGGWLYVLKPPTEKKPKKPKTKQSVVEVSIDSELEKAQLAITAIRKFARSDSASGIELSAILKQIAQTGEAICKGIPIAKDPLPKAHLLAESLKAVEETVPNYQHVLAGGLDLGKEGKIMLKGFKQNYEGEFLPAILRALEILASRMNEAFIADVQFNMQTAFTRLKLGNLSGDDS